MNLTFSGYEIDLRRQELRRGGVAVHVEPQVYDLLVHLVSHRDRVVSKDELFDTVWNGRIVSDAALSSRINAARKAIGDDGERQSLIKTIHRRGFRFIGMVEEHVRPPAAAPPPWPANDASGCAAAGPLVPSESAAASQRPKVAVLPFASPGSDTDPLCDGLTADVIRLLARSRWLVVLSRHAVSALLERTPDPCAVGQELGARYVVQGTVFSHAGQVRITIDLISGETGSHQWWDSCNAALSGATGEQTLAAQQIAAMLEPELARLEREASVQRRQGTATAWDCYQWGLWHLWKFPSQDLAEAEAMFRGAIDHDPGFARAYGALAEVALQTAVLRDPTERPALLAQALQYVRSAVALDDLDAANLCILGRVLCCRQEHEEALAFLEQAITVNPSFAPAYLALGITLIGCGRPGDAGSYLSRGAGLSPRDPRLAAFHAMRALACLGTGELETAEEFARKASRIATGNQWTCAVLAAVMGLQGRSDEARRALDSLMAKFPTYTIAKARSDCFFVADGSLVERFIRGLRQAGLGDGARNPGTPRLGDGHAVAGLPRSTARYRHAPLSLRRPPLLTGSLGWAPA